MSVVEKQNGSPLPSPKPFLKWAGGKRQLLRELAAQVDRAKDFGSFHEPFLGGAALFFEMYGTNRLESRAAFLSDSNPRLIETYEAVRDDVEALIHVLRTHASHHTRDYYYNLRGSEPKNLAERAARMVYLNRTCFNGLYRENSRGEFNVPLGRYKNPKICDAENLRAVSTALQQAKLECRHFDTVLDRAKSGDFVYFDPPYVPLSKTSSFTAYDRNGFGETEQRKLASVFAELDRRSVKVLLSNSMTPLVRELYAGFRVDTIYANRAVNSRADRRGKVAEALVRNF